MKNILGIYSAPRPHWVGDGFPTRSMFSYNTHGRFLSPFLLLAHAGPYQFGPTDNLRGISQHPHRGFEAVTLVYDGELTHRDSSGADELIGPGDVQWMTAASGILHEEFHSPAFSRNGGTIDVVQLWINLPARDKSCPPGYQRFVSNDIPSVALPSGAGQVRVIAGNYEGCKGLARTHTPMDIWDLRLRPGQLTLRVTKDWTTVLVVLKGTVQINGSDSIRESQFVLFDRQGQLIRLDITSDVTALLLGGEPINEPLVGRGPFVMNNEAEITQATIDYDSGRFGKIAS